MALRQQVGWVLGTCMGAGHCLHTRAVEPVMLQLKPAWAHCTHGTVVDCLSSEHVEVGVNAQRATGCLLACTYPPSFRPRRSASWA